ncbi:MAG TPA: RDD family protein [Pyrinomonadaceae bacterium]|nr:RDD family protein [Pyrinomonadaceae bacterium]
MPTRHYYPPAEKRMEKVTTADLVAESAEPNLETGRLEPPTAVAEEAPVAAKREFTSTLIEFPKRKNDESEWRDALRERVRAARERREGGEEIEKPRETKVEAAKQKSEVAVAASGTVINLKPSVENRPANNIIARALERVERSRQVHQSAATAVALAPVFEPQAAPRLQQAPKPFAAQLAAVPQPAEIEAKPKSPAPLKFEAAAVENAKFDSFPKTENAPALKVETTVKPLETAEVGIGVTAPLVTVAPAAPKKEPRKLPMISEADADKFIESQMRISAAVPQKKPSPRSGVAVEQEIAPRVRDAESDQPEIAEDYAPLSFRFIAALLDIALCAGAAFGLVTLFAPAGFFTAEKFGLESALTCFGVFAAIKFIYLTGGIVLAETTFGGRLFSLRTVHAEDGSAATILEAMLNTLGYLLTLALAGVGLIVILLNTERRAVHDWLSGTVVIREN